MKKRTKGKGRKGFTLVEIMAVLFIIGLLAAVAVTSFMGHTDRARVVTTRAKMSDLEAAVNLFKLSSGRYPDEDAGLIELIEQPADIETWQPGGYLTKTEVPKDAWGNDFAFELNTESGKPFVIISYGADGEPGGEDLDADLYSTDAY